MTEFETIYRTYFQDVFCYIRRLSGNEHIAEEITEETFYKALRSIDGFRGECDIRVWLCQIAKNCYYTYWKQSDQTAEPESLELLPVPDESAEERLIRQEEVLQIQRILYDIPDPYREVFLWRVYAQLTYRQIGQIFGKSENWACVTYHRARNRIRERLKEEQHEKPV